MDVWKRWPYQAGFSKNALIASEHDEIDVAPNKPD